jgi:hypothetical protein
MSGSCHDGIPEKQLTKILHRSAGHGMPPDLLFLFNPHCEKLSQIQFIAI